MYHCLVASFSCNNRRTVNMAGDPELRVRKVMLEVLSDAARYSDVLQFRHFVCDADLRRTTRKGHFLVERRGLWLLEEKIRTVAYRWRIEVNCRRDCVSLNPEPFWPLVGR